MDDIVSEVIDLRPNLDSDDDTESDQGERSQEGGLFKKRKLSLTRVFRRNNNQEEEEEEDKLDMVNNDVDMDGLNAPSSPPLPDLIESTDSDDDSDEDTDRVRARRITRAGDIDDNRERLPDLTLSSDDDSSSTDDNDEANKDKDIQELTKVILAKTPIVRNNNYLRDHHHLQLGRGELLKPSYRNRLISSHDLVSRLHMVNKLTGHEGCVNSLNFNRTGTMIASGSDDLSIILWDWVRGKKRLQYNTGHRSNVFQSKIMPGDLLISSCSRDGQVSSNMYFINVNSRSFQ